MSIRKSLLALAAVALLSAFAIPLFAEPAVAPPQPVWLPAATGSQLGSCRITCTGGGKITLVSLSTTEAQCCSGDLNPCPAGTTPGGFIFVPTSGLPRFCGPAVG